MTSNQVEICRVKVIYNPSRAQSILEEKIKSLKLMKVDIELVNNKTLIFSTEHGISENTRYYMEQIIEALVRITC